jgi:dipeptidyl aminopeptidase/acylaminoacyl peptidase
MKRILILCGVLALPAGVGFSSLRDAADPGIPHLLVESKDTSVIVRRVFEGPSAWGFSASPDGRYVTQIDWETGDLAVLDLLSGQQRRVTNKGEGGWASSGAFPEGACFSPDGHQIAYTWHTDSALLEVRVVNSDGTDSRLVARPGFDPANPPPPSWISEYEWWPALEGWSPDGRHILARLFYRDRQEVTLLSVADGSQEVLYVSEDNLAAAALSPDGLYLAYEEEDDIFIRPVSGGNAVTVASGPSDDDLLGWTPQGNLIFLSDRDLTEGVWRVPMRDGQPAGEATLVAGDLWGMEPMGIAGNTLFYRITTQVPRLHVARLDLAENRVLAPPTPVEPQIRESSGPAWSPDGHKLLYFADSRLVLRSIMGGEIQDVTPEALSPGGAIPRWSKDGRHLLVFGTERESGKRGYFRYTLATGEIQFLISFSEMRPREYRFSNGAISRDGGTVFLVTSERPDGPAVLFRIDLAKRDRHTLLTLPLRADGGLPIGRPQPSPDGRALAFFQYTRPDTARTLRVMPADGGEPSTLLTVPDTHGAGYADCGRGRRWVEWTSDGKHLLILLPKKIPQEGSVPTNPCKLYKVPVEGGEPIFVGATPKQLGQWALSPDGSRLAFETGEDRGEIWILQGLDGR